MNKKKMLLLIVLILLVVPLTFAGFASLSRPVPQKLVPPTQLSPTTTQTASPITYDTVGNEKLATVLRTRPPLSTADQAIKNKLITKPNPLVVAENFTIEYLPEPNIFQAEITTIRIDTAKQEAVAWLTKQGMSQAGVCNLPLAFYMNDKTAESLKGLNIILDPMPPGC